ncbi:MAG: hypothetical protein H0X63_04015 [Flavobacteriales bacterium]|jgi:hypothetical protein|nr:hypothetical protein [Flavobacteriales bacterium]
MGQTLENISKYVRKTANGFEQKIDSYQAKNCIGYQLKSISHKSEANRTIEINHRLIKLKAKAK